MGKIDETNLDEQQKQDQICKMLDAISLLLGAVQEAKKAIVGLELRVRALELHAQHQDQVKQSPAKEA